MADKLGIYKKNNLRVQILRMENAPDRRAALLSDQVDVVGSSLDDLAVTLSQDVNAVAFLAADFSNGGDGILGGGAVRSLSDLTRVPVAAQPGFVNHFFLLYVLDRNSLTVDGLQIEPMTPDDAGAAFIAGKINAAVSWEPHLTNAMAARKDAVLLASSKDYPTAILDLFICTQSTFKERKSQIDAFVRSWDEAVREMRHNPHRTAEIIGSEIGFEPPVVNEMLGGVKLLTSEEGQALIGPELVQLSERVERLWRTAGYVSSDIDLAAALKLNASQSAKTR